MQKVYTVLCAFLLIFSCTTKKEKDTSECDDLLLVIDSLLVEVNTSKGQTLEHLYTLTDNNLKDSLKEKLNLSDSIGFYQYIENDMNNLNQFFNQTQKEINFTKEQLLSLKTEYAEDKITEQEFEDAVREVDQMIHFLKERVDTNLMIVQRRYQLSADTLTNAMQNEKSE
jgi:Fe2+ transport system protein B